MSKIMLINVTHPEENRVGIVNNGVLESFEIESLSREHLKGNIYKAVVHRTHPALEAAFLDIGAERDAFLPLDEICYRNLPNNGQRGEGRPRIKDVLKPGQEILVQVVKDPFAGKPPTLSTFYSLPGRYLVLLPGSEESGISRRIEGEERARLRALVEELQPPEGFGIIVRTAAGFDETKRELERDLGYLKRLWESIQKGSEAKKGPGLVYREHDLVMRNIRDYFTPDIDEIYVDNEEVFQRARGFLQDVMPGKEHVLRLYRGDQPIFSHFNVESEIESIYKRRVPLKSGGSIVIDGTEALTAIDVNSGGSVRGGNQEETAYQTNMEAAGEIARQLRLRDLGGLIVIDFIDMRLPQHNRDVEHTLREAMRPDKARHDIGHISRLGLLEISRQRLRPAAAASSYTACPMCEGHGLVRTTESASLVALRKIHNRVAHGDVALLRVTVPPEVAVYLLNQKREDLALLEQRYGARVHVVMSDSLMPHQSEFEIRTKVEAPVQAATVAQPGQVVPPEAEPPARGDGAGAAAGNGQSSGKKRRRRRRGRGRGKQAAQALGDAFAALGAQAGMQTEPRVADDGEASESGAGEPTPVVEAPPEREVAAVVRAAAPAPPTAADTPLAPAAAGRGRRRSRGGVKHAASRERKRAATKRAAEPAPKAPAAPKPRSRKTAAAGATKRAPRSPGATRRKRGTATAKNAGPKGES